MNLLSLNDLTPYYNDLEMIKQTADQVVKDFEWFNIPLHFSGEASKAYEELFEQILPEIERLMENNYQRLLDLLYRIDVSEKKVAAEVNNCSAKELANVLTDLILKRELQKVVTRNYFKKQV